MRKIKNPIKNKRREITLAVVSIMVLVLFFSGYSMGKEYSNTNIETEAKIAEPILMVENNPIVEINGKKAKEYYNFKVKNYKENGEITQVDLQYNIEIISKTEESINFKLYKNQQEIPMQNNKTADMKLQKEEIQEDRYQLEIIYDKTKSRSVADIIQDVQIKVHSEQLKV
ncbi:MAG: hypothetical protein HFJ33_01375 [Clostridia bacterium]|nr:hypothetical protein [Clostridia bacterium]